MEDNKYDSKNTSGRIISPDDELPFENEGAASDPTANKRKDQLPAGRAEVFGTSSDLEDTSEEQLEVSVTATTTPPPKQYNMFERQSMCMARNPCLFFWISLLTSLALGAVGMVVGDFGGGADNVGWQTRGTPLADRHTQFFLVQLNEEALFSDTTGAVWNDLINNVQPGWEVDDDGGEERRLTTAAPSSKKAPLSSIRLDDIGDLGSRLQRALHFEHMRAYKESVLSGSNDNNSNNNNHLSRRMKTLPRLSDDQVRLLNTLNSTEGTLLEGCDVSWYSSPLAYVETRLWPVWRTTSSQTSFFDSNVLEELCLEEQKTQSILEEQKFCIPCGDSDKCLQPYSTVFYARLTVENGMSLSCQELAAAWTNEGQDVKHKTSLQPCVNDTYDGYNVDADGTNLPESCPDGFFPTILDERYTSTERAEYSSTIFATEQEIELDMYDYADDYAQGQAQISGAYDTQYEDFVNTALDDQLLIDMALAIGSAVVTTLAMLVHTRSPFLTLVGLLQIVLSFPVAYFWYTLVCRLEFFPFLNFIGIFVLFALGADDVFVAVDKWKNARLKHPEASVEEIAAMSFPDAALAMLLTSTTTAVAFFGTAVCPVAPILCFAVFCGLLVTIDYILCVILVFPALCIYDKADHEKRCCCHCKCFTGCKCCQKTAGQQKEVNEKQSVSADGVVVGVGSIGVSETKDNAELVIKEEEVCSDHDESGTKEIAETQIKEIAKPRHAWEADNDSLIHRILYGYYKCLYMVRWPLLFICGGLLVWCAVKAAQLELPISSDVRLFSEEDNQYEQNYVWRKNLLFDILRKKGGSAAYVIWGVTPGDTGNLNNPDEFSQLLLDDSFQPSKKEAQEYLLAFCSRFFAEDFARPPYEDFRCPIERFDGWLRNQTASDSPSTIYTENCNGANGLPMAEENFDACMYNWGQAEGETSVLARNGVITVMYFPYNSRVRFDSPFADLDSEWHLIEDWMQADQATNAPPSASQAYFTSEDYWWYDTNEWMLNTAYTSVAIAMAAAAGIILVSSRSLVMTIFATVTVGYVLTSVTATLVALGWTLGFLESILFAILIGISCDFVIHFSHAYTHLKGHTHCDERTKFALISMGPSILAGAFTTFSAALVMLFTVITFFEKFAIVLFLTVIQALLGSFVVFLTMTLCMGPADPTYLFDHVMAKCMGWCGRSYKIQGDQDESEE